MSAETDTWEPFGIPDEYYDEDARPVWPAGPERDFPPAQGRPEGREHSNPGGYLAAGRDGALGVLAAAAAVVSV